MIKAVVAVMKAEGLIADSNVPITTTTTNNNNNSQYCNHTENTTSSSLSYYNLSSMFGCSELAAKLIKIPPRIAVYTFGTPRVGNSVFSNLIERKISDYFRVEVDGK
jgi:hypothetical protein